MFEEAARILIVDDEVNTLKAYNATLGMNGFTDIVTEQDSRKVLETLEHDLPDLLILDLYMPHVTGMELLPLIKERYPCLPVVVVTAAYEIEKAVECMKTGAFDYLVKPVEGDRLVTTIRRALEWRALHAQMASLRDHLLDDRLDRPDAFAAIITRNRKMRSIFQYVEAVSRSPQPILITGESGTGKELIARAVHQVSRCPGELVSINLGGLDDNLFSDALFGHKKGAFTGAIQGREGLVARAEDGTLFMDEIGDLDNSSQVRLLRLLQEREYYPVGSDTPRRCNARIVCASNRDLKELVNEGKFRNDLYYRLCIHHVSLPPLRQRREDVPLLVDHFMREAAEKLQIPPVSYPRELLELLDIHHFPGNVRELQSMVADAVARTSSGMMSLEPFRRGIEYARTAAALKTARTDITVLQQKLEDIWGHIPTLEEAEDCLMEVAMAAAGGNQGVAATMLGLKRQTLNMRLKVRKERDR